MRVRVWGFLTAMLIAGAAPASAQWDVPSFMAPRPGDDIGVYITTQGSWGLHGIWRSGGLGVRGGYIDVQDSDGVWVLGAEAFGRILSAGAGSPVDASVTAGFGGAFNGGTVITIPLGLSVGLLLPAQQVSLQPYVHPRVALDLFEDNNGDLDTDFNALLNIGADIGVGAMTVRLAGTFGEGGEVFGVGVAFNAARGVAVR